jgi:hypothetical protein
VVHDPDQRQHSGADFCDFICTCSQEELARSVSLMAEVRRRLSEGSKFPGPLDVSDAHLLTSVVTSLNWDFKAHITEILNEQWSAVFAESDDGTYRTSVQCDEVEHGIAATWKAFADRADGKSAN